MALVPAKCPECGGDVSVDNAQKAAICEFCKQPFIIEEAINNYITYNTINNDNRVTHNYGEGAVVNVYENSASVENLLERVNIFLADGDFASADEYCEKVLDLEAENAKAYLGKTLAEFKIRKIEDIDYCEKGILSSKNYQKTIRFADVELKSQLVKHVDAYKENRYKFALGLMRNAKTIGEFNSAADVFKIIYDYKDSRNLCQKCVGEVDRLTNYKKTVADISNKNTDLSKINEDYKKLENAYNERKRLLKKHNTNIVVGVLLVLAILSQYIAFALGIALAIAGVMNDFFGYALVALIVIAYFVIIILWQIYSKKVLNNRVGLRIVKFLCSFIPVYITLWPLIEVATRITPTLKRLGKAKKDVADCFENLNKCGQARSITEKEIEQLKQQVNMLAVPRI